MKNMFLSLFFFLTTASMAEIKLPVHYDTLPNGLKVIIVPDTNVAVVSCRLYYFVGSMYEGPGTSGLSHMYEHMMFKGTKRLGTKNYQKEVPIMKSIDSLVDRIGIEKNKKTAHSDSLIEAYQKKIHELLDKQREQIKKDEIWELYQNNGGTNLNAWTADDMTAYIVTLPKNKMELFYWIESDRMKEPVLREFYSERDVVMEERRMRYDNRPVNKYWERLNSLFYIAHPYRLPTIGWESDIAAYTRQKMEEHVRRFYTPDNALIVLVGNVEPKTALMEIKRYFNPIPRAKQPKQEVVTREPSSAGTIRFTMRAAGEPRMDILFHTPGYPADDLYKLDIIQGIFSGKSGRLYRRLVNKEGLCTDVGAANNFRLQDGYFEITASLKGDTDPAKVEKIIFEELDKISTDPPTPQEMMRITNGIRMDFITGLESLEHLSDQLAWFERLGSWEDLEKYPSEIAKVTAQQIPPIVKKYLRSDQATIGSLLPEQQQALKAVPENKTQSGGKK
jgi:predicted Zn-dependent peptidase